MPHKDPEAHRAYHAAYRDRNREMLREKSRLAREKNGDAYRQADAQYRDRNRAGETPEMAMEREFGEEAGLDLGGWEHFATLSGEGFEVWFYRIESALVRGVRSAGDEDIDLYPVGTLAWREDRISNIGWLVNMALPGSRHDWPYVICERAFTAPDTRIPLAHGATATTPSGATLTVESGE